MTNCNSICAKTIGVNFTAEPVKQLKRNCIKQLFFFLKRKTFKACLVIKASLFNFFHDKTGQELFMR